jgi:DNA-binding GntR family transcriptional regulator
MSAKLDAYDYLKKHILSGALLAGSTISPAEIAKTLKVSRVPVREAILQLEAEGLITMSATGRPMVISLTADDVLEVFEIRIALESLAMEKAALRMTAADLDELASDLQRMERVKSSPKRWLEMHDAFHDRIYKAANMPRLLSEIRQIRQSIHPYLLMYINFHKSPEISGQEHSSLLSVLRTRDGKLAAQALALHVRRGAAQLVYAIVGGRATSTDTEALPATAQKVSSTS